MPELHVNRTELIEALKLFRRIRPGYSGDELVLSFTEGQLTLERGGITATATARGSWAGRARIGADLLPRLGALLPPDDPVTLRVQHGMLFIARSGLPGVQWDDDPQLDLVPTAVNDGRLDLLKRARQYPEDRLRASGLTGAVGRAEAWRAELAQKAARTLEPLGITPRDVDDLIEGCLRREAAVPMLTKPVQASLPLSGEGGRLGLS